MLGRPRLVGRRKNAQRGHILTKGRYVLVRDLFPAAFLGIGPVDDLIVDVREVPHIRDIIAGSPKVAGDYIEDQGAPGVADVGVVVHRHAAHVEARLTRYNRDKAPLRG